MNTSDRSIARNVGNKYDPVNFRVMGHNVYVRRCINPDIEDDDGNVIIVLPDIVANNTNCAEVLAIGPKVGKPRDEIYYNRKRRKQMGLNLCYNMSDLQVGDLVYLPQQSVNAMMWRGGLGNDYELIVDESELIARIPKEELNG